MLQGRLVDLLDARLPLPSLLLLLLLLLLLPLLPLSLLWLASSMCCFACWNGLKAQKDPTDSSQILGNHYSLLLRLLGLLNCTPSAPT